MKTKLFRDAEEARHLARLERLRKSNSEGKISIQMETIQIRARSRRLGRYKRVTWRGRKFCWFTPIRYTVELAQDLGMQHGLDVEQELVRALTAEICQ